MQYFAQLPVTCSTANDGKLGEGLGTRLLLTTETSPLSLKVDQKAKFVPRGMSAQFVDEAQCDSRPWKVFVKARRSYYSKPRVAFVSVRCAVVSNTCGYLMQILWIPHILSLHPLQSPFTRPSFLFSTLQFSNRAWRRGSGDETIVFPQTNFKHCYMKMFHA